MVGCCIKDVGDYIKKSGFSKFEYRRCHVDLTGLNKPMHALMPHIYGYAIK